MPQLRTPLLGGASVASASVAGASVAGASVAGAWACWRVGCGRLQLVDRVSVLTGVPIRLNGHTIIQSPVFKLALLHAWCAYPVP